MPYRSVAIALLLFSQVAASFEFGIGVHVGIGRHTSDLVESRLEGTQFNAIRDDLLWSRVERADGTVGKGPELRGIDRLATTVERNRRATTLILGYGNAARGVTGLPETEEQRAAYLDYVRWSVRRYAGQVKYFEVWNEWNAGLGSGVFPRVGGSARSYVELLKSAYSEIKRIAPDAVVLGGGVAGTDSRWMEEFVRLGGLKYLDGVSLHPYVHFKREKGTPERAIGWLDEWRKKATEIDPENAKPFFITEIGWPTSSGPEGVSEDTAADFLLRFLLMARARPWIAGVWVYELIDGTGRGDNNENRFGLYAADGRKKRAFDSVAAFGALQADNAAKWTEDAPRDGLRVVRMHSTERDCVALWADTISHSKVRLDVTGDGATERYPESGNLYAPGRQTVLPTSGPKIVCGRDQRFGVEP